MKKHTRALAAAFLLSLSPAMVLAQSVPDEVDYVRYRNALNSLQDKLETAREARDAKVQERDTLTDEIEQMAADRTELPSRTAELTQSIAAKRERLTTLDSEIRQMTTNIDRSNQELTRLAADVERQRQVWRQEENTRVSIANRLQALDQDIARLRGQLDLQVNEEREAAGRLGRTEEEMRRIQDAHRSLSEDRKQRTAQNMRDERALPQVRTKVQQADYILKKAQEDLAPAEAAVAQAQKEVAAREGAIAQANAAMAPMQRRVEAARAEVTTAANQLSSAERITTDAEATVRNLEQRKSSAAGQIQSLQNSISSLNTQIEQTRASLPALDEAANQAKAEMDAAKVALDEAQAALRATSPANRPAFLAASLKVKGAENTLKASQSNASAKGQAAAQARNSITQAEGSISNNTTQITNLQTFLGTVDSDIARERAKIDGNASNVANARSNVAQKRQALQTVEGELSAASIERDRLQPQLNQARQQLATANSQRDGIVSNVQRLRSDLAIATKELAGMEASLATFNRDIQAIDVSLAKMNRKLQAKDVEAERERRMLIRVREDRVRIQNQLGLFEQQADGIAGDLQAQEANVRNVEVNLQSIEARRTEISNVIESSRRSMNESSASQAELRTSIQEDQTEITANNARLAVINRDFAGLQPRINKLTQEIAAANQQLATLSTQVGTADGQYQQRLNLFQKYLGDAKTLGTSRGATVGTNEGQRAGIALINSTAARLGGNNGSEEGRFEALLRGFVRSEIAGYNSGRQDGLASLADATRGDKEGAAAGMQDARNQADQVLKPQYYTAEYTHRLSDPTVTDEVSVKLAEMSKDTFEKPTMEKAAEIPALSGQELSQSQSIRTALDERINSAIRDLAKLRDEQVRLGQAQNVYLAPSDVRTVLDGKACEGVYKAVAELVAACQESFRVEYNARFVPAHKASFMGGYSAAFQAVVQREREAAIQREFAANYREGEAVARAAGLAVGKEEVYQQHFVDARRSTYDRVMPEQDARARGEAVNMVNELFAANGVAIMTEAPILKSSNVFGVAPGTSVDVGLVLKNVGSQMSAEGAVKVRIIEASPSLVPTRMIAPLKALPARKLVRTNADFGFKVSDQAAPGQKVRLVAEVTFPGHDYAPARVEKIEMEEVLGTNPTAAVDVSFTNNPEVSGLLGTKTHEIGVNLTAKFRGLTKGYEVSIEEVDTKLVELKTKKGSTKTLAQGASGKTVLSYKLLKAAKGKDVTLKVVVRYGTSVVEERLLTLKPR